MEKFIEDLNTAVLTTRFVFLEGQPILNIFHHEEDGFWEFIGDGIHDEEDYMLISLEEIIAHDSSVLEVANLPLGKMATRKNMESKWLIENIP